MVTFGETLAPAEADAGSLRRMLPQAAGFAPGCAIRMRSFSSCSFSFTLIENFVICLFGASGWGATSAGNECIAAAARIPATIMAPITFGTTWDGVLEEAIARSIILSEVLGSTTQKRG